MDVCSGQLAFHLSRITFSHHLRYTWWQQGCSLLQLQFKFQIQMCFYATVTTYIVECAGISFHCCSCDGPRTETHPMNEEHCLIRGEVCPNIKRLSEHYKLMPNSFLALLCHEQLFSSLHGLNKIQNSQTPTHLFLENSEHIII